MIGSNQKKASTSGQHKNSTTRDKSSTSSNVEMKDRTDNSARIPAATGISAAAANSVAGGLSAGNGESSKTALGKGRAISEGQRIESIGQANQLIGQDGASALGPYWGDESFLRSSEEGIFTFGRKRRASTTITRPNRHPRPSDASINSASPMGSSEGVHARPPNLQAYGSRPMSLNFDNQSASVSSETLAAPSQNEHGDSEMPDAVEACSSSPTSNTATDGSGGGAVAHK